VNLYEFLQKSIKKGWELRHVELEIGEGNIAAFIARPEMRCYCGRLLFINGEGRIIVPTSADFSSRDLAIFSDVPDAREVSIHDGNVHIHIALERWQQQGGGDGEIREAHDK